MDLSTTYLGFKLAHPFICGAGPLSDSLDTVRRLEDAGAGAIVMRSLFEEQLAAEALATHTSTEAVAESYGEALSYFPSSEEFVLGPQEYLDKVRKLKEAVHVKVIASLNGVTLGNWLEYARLIEQAGADALELNVFQVATDGEEPAETVERRLVEMVAGVKQVVRIPVAVKLAPFYTAFANLAGRLDDVRADGLVLFNRFYEPDVDTEQLEFDSHLHLSTSAELLLRLRWLAILSGRLQASLAVTGGVHTVLDAVKAVMCGAHAVQLVSALLRQGPVYLRKLVSELGGWLAEHEYSSLAQMQGNMNLLRCPDPAALARGNYVHMLQTWEG